MSKIYRYVLILILFFIISPAKGEEIEVCAREYDGVMIYRLPYAEKINITKIILYSHYMPLRAKQGWTYAFIDLGYKMTNPVIVEEIPGGAGNLIGRRPFCETVYIVLKGKGYTEIRKDAKTPGKGIYWEKGDAFTAPYGYWVGHANPYDHPARILSLGVAITNDLLNPDIEMAANRPKLPYVLNLLSYEQDDTYAGKVKPKPWVWPSEKTLKPLEEIKGYTVYRTTWGASVNLDTLKTLRHHFFQRATAGWKSCHIELGGRILNWFVVQDMPPKTIEIGHKHGGEVVFLGLKGRGSMAFKEDEGSPESRIYWGPGDLFCLPWASAGQIWHVHSNPYDEPARLLASVHQFWGDDLLNPFIGQVHKPYNAPRATDRVFGKAGEIKDDFIPPNLDVVDSGRIARESERTELMGIDKIMDLLKIKTGMTILDIGTGTGQPAFKFAERLKGTGKIFTTDVLKSRIDYVREESSRRGFKNIYPVLVGREGVDEFYNKHKYGLIFLSHVYHALPDRVNYVKTMRGFLAKNGQLAILLHKNAPLFSSYDIIDFKGLIKELAREPADSPFYKGLRKSTRELIKQKAGSQPEELLKKAIVDDFNSMLLDPNFHNDFFGRIYFKTTVSFLPEERNFANWLILCLEEEGVFDKAKKDLMPKEIRAINKLNRLFFIQRFRQYLVREGLGFFYPGSDKHIQTSTFLVKRELKEAGYKLVNEYELLPCYDLLVFADSKDREGE